MGDVVVLHLGRACLTRVEAGRILRAGAIAGGRPVITTASVSVRCDTHYVGLVMRQARPDDQTFITAMVRRARLNPAGLHWEPFVVGEWDGRAVGIAQLRRHPDGVMELGSLVVEPEMRGRGIATRMVDTLLADEAAAVYVLLDRRFVGHFTRWGFSPVDAKELPRSISRTYLIGRAVTTIGSLIRRQQIRIVPLLRAAR